ncbi:MAG: ABC transporter ATP-binding protein [Limnochordia bacterium]|jgi:multiple sugar transport system ATP-binding protein
MGKVVFDDVTKVFNEGTKDEVIAVNRANLTIKDGEFAVLVGPSGCGKSTSLRMVAGLERPTSGRIFIGDRDVTRLHPRARDIAMVFQDYALYPHMSVKENLSFGLKNLKYPRQEIERRVQEASEILGIDNLLDRQPRQLSGGQRQRVALGRAIVRNPQVFLLDEPLSNLDAKLRVQMRVELSALQRRLGTTMIYVTHDQEEAMTLGHRIVVMREGVIQQVDTPEALYAEPANVFVAQFLGSPAMNMIYGRIEVSDGKAMFIVDDGAVKVEVPQHLTTYAGRELYMGIRPEDVEVNQTAEQEYVKVPVQVTVTEMLGSQRLVYFYVGNALWVSVVDPELRFKPEEQITTYWPHRKLHFFDGETEERI